MAGRVVVVGAGIGGLATALAFAQRGWAVTLLEKSEALEPVGAGIVLAPNAMRALDRIGVGEAVTGAGKLQGGVSLRTGSGGLLQRMASVEGNDGTPAVAIHRAELVRILVDALPDDSLRRGTRVAGVANGDTAAVVESSGRQFEADLVVAADGIRSVIRQQLFPGHPQPAFAGFTAWRAVVDAPIQEASESWGHSRIVGMVPLGDSRTYIYATAKMRAGDRAALSAEQLRERFAGWHEPIPALLAPLDDSGMLAHEVYWLKKPLPAFHLGRVALVGDAAHAMTPNLGQGACQAIEDAVTLAACVGAGEAAGLARYTEMRRPRASAIARQSSMVSRVAHWGGALGAMRDAAIRLAAPVASRVAARGARGVIDWVPPPG